MKKRFIAILVMAAFAIALFALPALAQQNQAACIIDEGDYLNDADESALNERAQALSEKYGMNVLFLVTNYAGEAGISQYIGDYYREAFGEANGVIFGHDIPTAKIGVRHFGTASELFTEEDDGRILDAYNDASSYAGGVEALLNAVEAKLSGGVIPEQTEEPVNQTTVPAQTAIPAGEPGVRIQDLANLLTESEKASIREKLDAVSRKHDCDVVVITCRSLGSKSARLYAADFYEATGFSKDGIVMLVCPEERDYAFCATGDGMKAMTDDAYRKLENTVVADELHDDRYYDAFSRFADYADQFLTTAENGKPYKEKLVPTGFAGVIAGIVGLITGGIGTGSMKSKLKSVHSKNEAYDYMQRDSLNIVNANETYLYSTFTKTPIPRETRGSSGSSGSFHSSSGSSWSGSSGKY